jgi:hypothetical protein
MTGKKPTKEDQNLPTKGEFLLYQTEDGQTRIEIRLQYETVWVTQAAIAELYQTTPQNISTHLKAIYNEGELEETATCKEYLQVQQEGSRKVSRTRKFYQ